MADLIVLMTVRLEAGAGLALDAAAFWATVPVLDSLDTLVPLTFRFPRVGAVVLAVGSAGFFAFMVEPGAVVMVVDDPAGFRVSVVPRDPLAFSTTWERRFDEDFAVLLLASESGGCSAPRGSTRTFVDAGDRTWDSWGVPTSAAPGPPRAFLLGTAVGSTEFSLSSTALMSSLKRGQSTAPQGGSARRHQHTSDACEDVLDWLSRLQQASVG